MSSVISGRMATDQKFSVHSGALHIHGLRLGTGQKHLLAFHGYGQEASMYSPFVQAFPGHTIWSFDLPFHGRSVYTNAEIPISKKEWLSLVQQFIKNNKVAKFSIAAYSMGGKFALATLEGFYKNTTSLYLIAPDGIKTSLWYSMSTYPRWARSYFKKMVDAPEPFVRLVNTLHKYKVVDAGILKFAEWHMNSTAKRQKVYNSWTTTSQLTFKMATIARLLTKNSIPLELFIGKHDKLMTPQGMQRLLKHLPEKNYKLHILPTGHSGLIGATANYIQQHAPTISPR